jgi:lysophospholipase L1-like esterase
MLAVDCSILLACALGEIALRCAGYSRSYVNPIASFHENHPLVGWRGKPNFVGRFRRPEFDVLVAHDELGFRRHEHQQPREECRHKAIVLGDSFTWGWGVGQGQVFTDQMNLLMPGYWVENFGLTASGTVQQWAIFDAYVRERLRPGDTVVVAFFCNDFGDNINSSGGAQLCAQLKDGRVCLVPPRQPPREYWKNSLKRYSYLFNLAAYCWDLCVLSRNVPVPTDVSMLGDQAPAVIVTRHFLAEFRKACAEKQARFVVAYVPGQGELGESLGDAERCRQSEQVVRRAFFQCAESLGIETIDLLPSFLEAKQAGRFERLTFCRDAHWNAAGHTVAAEAIARYILERDGQQVGKMAVGSGTSRQ